MRLKVVGWTEYDLHEFKEGANTWAVRMALVDDIKKNGYFFSGYDHQERDNCAPVFNDGKMRRFSQRGFADIMAEAQGDNDYMGYARYMFGLEPSACRFPQNEVLRGDVRPERDLAETFELPVEEPFFTDTIRMMRDTELPIKRIKLPDLPQLRYIDEGDTLVLTCGDRSAAYGIRDVERGRDLSYEERIKIEMRMNDYNNEVGSEAARAEFMSLPVTLTLSVRQRRKWKKNDPPSADE